MNSIGLRIIATLTVILLTSGCASMKQDLLKMGIVELETVPVKDVTYLYTNVWQKGEKIYFSGRITLKDASTWWNDPAHLDISIYNAEGKALHFYHAPYRHIRHTRRRNQFQYFASAKLLVTDGSRVLLKHHFAEAKVHD